MKVIRLFARSFQFLGEARSRYLLGVALGACELALLFTTPTINQMLIDVVTGERQGNVVYTLLGMLAVFLLLVPPVVAGRYLQATAAAQGSAHLRKKLFRHILSMPVEEQSKFKAGDFLTRLTDDVNRTTEVFASFSMQQLIRFVVVFTVTLVLLLVHDWRIALAGAAYGVINLALSLRLNPYAKSLEADAKTEVVRSASFLMEAIRGIPIVRVFTLGPVLGERYRRICECIREKRMKYRTVIGITYGVVDFFSQSGQAVGFLLGVLLAGDKVSLGQAVFNATLMGMMADSVYRLSTFLLLIQPNLVGMERVFHLLSRPAEVTFPQRVLPTQGKVAVELRDVSFSYGEKPVLDHVSLTVRRGEHLAIVGGSGGGKSTLIKVIEAFYRPQSGELRYFGVAEETLSPADIRALFAYVPQECTLFDGTIGENIALGRPGASQEEVESAAKEAGIHSFIQNMPQGYATPVGEAGGQLSGGQRQRVAIARALLKGTSILLLDEATAALDSQTEREIQQCLDRVSADRTTVTVAHRLSTIENAHRILVMEDGCVVEEGRFHQLLERSGGRFRALYESQQREET